MINTTFKEKRIEFLISILPENKKIKELVKKLKKYLRRYNYSYLTKTEREFIKKFPSYCYVFNYNLSDMFRYFGVKLSDFSDYHLRSIYGKRIYKNLCFPSIKYLEENRENKRLEELRKIIIEKLKEIAEHTTRLEEQTKTIHKLFDSLNDLNELKEISPEIYELVMTSYLNK